MNVLRQIARELRTSNLLKLRDSMIRGSLEWQRVTEQIEREMNL